MKNCRLLLFPQLLPPPPPPTQPLPPPSIQRPLFPPSQRRIRKNPNRSRLYFTLVFLVSHSGCGSWSRRCHFSAALFFFLALRFVFLLRTFSDNRLLLLLPVICGVFPNDLLTRTRTTHKNTKEIEKK